MKASARNALVWVAAGAVCASVCSAQVSFSIDQAQGRSPISPLIYGINTGGAGGVANPGLNQAAYQNLNLTFERIGGNRWTAYNWTNNASNAGSDYYYSSDNYLGGGATPGGAVLPFLQGAGTSAGALVTVPINGYVSADESGDQNPATLPQNSTHFVPEYPTAAQDPAPAANHVYQNGFVQFVKNNFSASAGQPLAFDLDNEPDLWSSTHREVHPAATTYAELVSKSVAYATMIKSIDPPALVYGPASYGWNGYTSLQNAPDSAANGDFLNYYLKNLKNASTTAGVRLLDALDLHWYPEATGINASGNATRITATDTSPGVVTARLQAPRSLWDPTYTESSWITQYSTNGPINLIPLEQGKIAANYPGTKLSFGEYNYGAGQDISGGIAEADVLGIFGKYGVFSANEWPLAGSETFIAGAFRMFRNYDGKNSTFGDTEILSGNTDTVNSSIYASTDSKNPDHLTLVVINKQNTAVTAALNISNGGQYTSAAVYQLTGASATPQFAGNQSIGNPASFNYTMPAFSISTISLFSNQWLLSSGGSWNNSASWSDGIPGGTAAVANFLSAPTGITLPSTVTLDGNRTVGRIKFDNTNSYTIAAGSGGVLTIDDTGDSAGPAIVVLTGSQIVSAPITLINGLTVTTTGGTQLALNGNIGGSGGLTTNGSGTVVLGGNESYGNTTVNGGTLTVNGSLQAGSSLISNATTIFAANPGTGILLRALGPVNVGSGGLVTLNAAPLQSARSLLVASTLTIAGQANSWTGKLDLNNNDLDITTGSLPTLTNQITQGYNGGSWNGGGGITSSAAASDMTRLMAIGVIQNNQSGTALYSAARSFDGYTPGVADILAKYTYVGDANLDGRIDGSDYSLIDSGFLTQATG